jgi:hypothetical protein
MELEDASAEQMPQVMTLARLVPMAGRHSEKSFAGNSMLSTLSAENFSMPARGGPPGQWKSVSADLHNSAAQNLPTSVKNRQLTPA